MSKPFNIHDWQAKQRQLSEIRAQDVPGTAAFMGKNMRSRGMSNSEKNKASVDAFFKDLRDKEEAESMSNADIDALNKMVKKYSMDKIMKTINILKDRPLPEGMNELNPPSETSLSRDSEIDEHHAGDYKPGFLKQTVNTFLDKLKKKTKEGKDYKTVEKIMEKYFSAKKKNEASMTGTGASFNAGVGMGYATPKAFKKKNKDD